MSLDCLACVVAPTDRDCRDDVVRLLDACGATLARQVAGVEGAAIGVGCLSIRSALKCGRLTLVAGNHAIASTGDGLPIDPNLGLDWLPNSASECRESGTPVEWSRRFVVAHWNEARRELHVARDPLGMDPIYFAELGSRGVAVASRALALTELAAVSRRPDPETCAETLIAIPRRSGATFLCDVKELPRASVLRFAMGRVSVRKYFAFTPKRANIVTDAPFRMEKSLRASVNKCLRNSEAPAISLSGGVDSTSIFRVALGLGYSKIVPINAMFPGDPAANEDEYFELAVSGTGCTPFRFEPKEFLPLGDLLKVTDDPVSLPLSSIAISCAMMARAVGVDTLVTGEFGDFVGGDVRFPAAWLFSHGLWSQGFRLGVGVGGSTVRRGARLIRRLAESQMPLIAVWRNRYYRNAIRWLRTMSPHVRKRYNLDERLKATWRDATGIRGDIVRETEALFDRVSLKSCGTWWVGERVTGVRIEHPFADPSLAEVTAGLSFDERWANGLSRATLRQAMVGILPETIRLRGTKAALGSGHMAFLRQVRANLPFDMRLWPFGELVEMTPPGDLGKLDDAALISLTTAEIAAAWIRMVDRSRAT